MRPATVEQPFDKVLKDVTIGCSLEHAREKHAISGIRRQDLKSPLASMSDHLDRRRPDRGLTGPSETHTLVTARLITVDE
jgi:hypothetical protein